MTTRIASHLPQGATAATLKSMGMLEKILVAGRARGLTQGKVADLAGLAKNRLSKIKEEPEVLRWEEVTAMARVVGASLDWLASDAPDELPVVDPDQAWVQDAIRDLGYAEVKRRILGSQGPWKPVRGYVVPDRSGDDPGTLDAAVVNSNNRPPKRR